jgi:hypothetical protein
MDVSHLRTAIVVILAATRNQSAALAANIKPDQFG